MSALSNWREEFNLSEVVTGKMTDKEALRKVSEKSGINNKVTINPKLDEAVKEIGGEVVAMVEADTTAQKQRLDMKQMILDRQKLKLRRKDMSAAKQEKKVGVEGDSTGASKQANVIAQEEKFTPHKMIDPSTKKEYWASTHEEHIKYKDKGYVHEAADVKLESEKNCGCGQNPCITYGKKKLSQTQKVDEGDNEKKRKNALLIQKVIGEGGVLTAIGRTKKKEERKPQKAMDAGAKVRRAMKRREHAKYVSGSEDNVPDDIREGGYQPEIEHSKLGDAKKKKDKERESKLPPHLQGDAIGKMKKAFSQEGYRVLAKGDDGKRAQFSYKDEKDAKKFASTFKKATVTKEDKAFDFVKNKLKAKYGDGVLTTGEKMKPQTAAEKAKARAHQAKVDKENAAERAKDPSQGRYPKG